MRIEDINSLQETLGRIREISTLNSKVETEMEKEISKNSKPEFLRELELQKELEASKREEKKTSLPHLEGEKWNVFSKYFSSPGNYHKSENFSKKSKDHSTNLEGHIQSESRKKGLDPDLVRAIIKAESNFNPKAESPKGAMGLMQLMPSTADSLGVENPFDPIQNLKGGTNYLKDLLRVFKDKDLAIAAYNAGPGAVKKYGGVPPIPKPKIMFGKLTNTWKITKTIEDSQKEQRRKVDRTVFSILHSYSLPYVVQYKT